MNELLRGYMILHPDELRIIIGKYSILVFEYYT